MNAERRPPVTKRSSRLSAASHRYAKRRRRPFSPIWPSAPNALLPSTTTSSHLAIYQNTSTRSGGSQRWWRRGESRSDKRPVERLFARDATGQGRITLCSDALSESLSLQGASAIVHLDHHGILRVTEQRVGHLETDGQPL